MAHESLIERVASAIREIRIDGVRQRFSDEYLALMARAAIEAMKTPTEAMLAAFNSEHLYHADSGTEHANRWNAMIEAALK